MAGRLAVPPPLEQFLATGGDLAARLGSEAAILAAVYEIRGRLRRDQVLDQIARWRWQLCEYLDGTGPWPWPVDQPLIDRLAWCVELLEDDRLAESVEPVLRASLNWRDWPLCWQLVPGTAAPDGPESGQVGLAGSPPG